MRSKFLICLFLACMLMGCEPQASRQPSITANKIYWETDGGGQITFSITQDEQAYDVVVTSYQFRSQEDHFTIIAESGPAYQAISNIMRNQGSIDSDTSCAPSGSWTTLEFSNGVHSSIYKDVTVSGDLSIIYDYVAAQIKQTSEDLGGRNESILSGLAC